jgi:hypothetical protein
MPFWKKIKKKYHVIRLCPRCLKPTLKPTTTLFSQFSSRIEYYCEDCKYSGGFFVEYDPEETGEDFIDLEKLKKMFPEDVEPEDEK